MVRRMLNLRWMNGQMNAEQKNVSDDEWEFV